MRALAAVALLVAACGSPSTTLRLDVRFEDGWGLDTLAVSTMGAERDVLPKHQYLLTVPDAWAGKPLHIEIAGRRGAERRAFGKADLTAVARHEARGEIVLTLVPCGAWCQAGALECVGDGISVCAAGSDGCSDWSTPTPCATGGGGPYCSFGVCGKTCLDECAKGETRCEGPGALRICGQPAGHPCLQWLPPIACQNGMSCSAGACRSVCQSECAAGEVKCIGNNTVACGDYHGDGCLTWGPLSPCAAGLTCSNGACAATCTDECTSNVCDGNTFRVCGKFGLDACNHLSAGTSCVPADACSDGRCTATGCVTAPKVCMSPPSSTCVDAGTLRTYDTSGTCANGTCSYTPHDRACPNCPACDACAGVTCNTPPAPAVCYAASGTCSNGACSYAYNNGAACDDGNVCTTNKKCASGTCSGTAIACNTPPAAVCQSSTTLRTFSAPGSCNNPGGCTYPYADMSCANGCMSGACIATCMHNCWNTARPMQLARYLLATATGSDGKIYATGGYGSDYYNNVEVYTPANDQWAPGPAMQSKRMGHALVTGNDGNLYAFGGNDGTLYLASAEKLVIGATSWTPLSSMTKQRYQTAGALGSDGYVYALGGTNLADADLVDVERFVGPSWAAVTPMMQRRVAFGAARGADGYLYAVGGNATTPAAVELYSTSSNQWFAGNPMPTPRYGHAVVAGSDGRIYTFGGVDSGTNRDSNAAEAYTPSTNRWAPLAPMPTARRYVAAALAPDGRIFVIGGTTATGVLNTVEVYTP